jgi:apolipoprotein N-acyltransferase
MALGQAPYDFWAAMLAGMLLAMLGAMRLDTPRAGVRFGWVLGTVYFAVTLSWIVEPFFVDAVVHGWMAPFALAGMAGGLALFWAAAFGAALALKSARLPAIVILWTAAELARSYVLTGFPWAMPSQAMLDTPVMQWAAVGGQAGVMLGIAAFAAALAATTERRQRMAAIAASFGMAAALWGGGRALLPPLQTIDDRPVVRIVQPNAPQHQKWDPALIPVFFDRKIALTAAEPLSVKPSLILWPETAIPQLLNQAGSTLDYIAESAGSVPIAAGIQREEAGRFYNSFVVTDARGAISQVYDKHHLVPFGEYMPLPGLFARIGIAGLAARAAGGYSAGPGAMALEIPGLGTALPLICYEAVFPHRLTHVGFRPDWLLHATNDAWFGTRSGPYQHLAQARIRAIEQGLPMLRAANTGVSAAIDGAGRIIARLDLGEAAFLDVPLPPPLRVTPYSRTGDWPLIALLSVAFGLSISRVRPLSD